MLELVHLSYSPWSERARWALDHHGLDHRQRSYTPMLGELRLRMKLGKSSGRVTVPVLFTDGGAVTDSTDIARYADRVGSGTKLIPEDREKDVLEWVARADRALEGGRNLVTRRTGRSRAARMESLPPALRGTGFVGDAMARSGVDFFMKKYDLANRSEEEDERVVATELDTLRRALGGRNTLFDDFSFADIAASTIVQMVTPVADQYLRLGPATRAVWTTPALEGAFRDLVLWRDRLYDAYRRKR